VLTIGEALGQYHIVEKIGEGGMGVVYSARDTRLNRVVAIKILRADVAANPERLARFQREAVLLAALNHPNIAAIHGLEEHAGLVFLVLEFVEGETLDRRIIRGALKTREAIDIARQIARAIEEAHEKGIIHRDLKPANVKVTPDGVVKVLDFGLAKALSSDSSPGGPMSEQMTHEWTVLGTPAYMSPEQRRGGPVDGTTDNWAFGCVLFQMLTGVSAFGESTPADVGDAVLRGEPPWTILAPGVPPLLRTLVKSCLESNPRNRLRHIRDARLLLDAAAPENGSPVTETMLGPPPRPAWHVTVAIAALMAVGLMAGLAMARWFSPTEPPGTVRFPTSPPFNLKPSFAFGPSVVVSPDGRSVVYSLATGTTTMLYVKRMDELEARPVAGTQGSRNPFFSPLGQWIGFYDDARRKLKKVSLGGGEPVVVAETDFQGGAVWGPDDTILFASNDGLVRVPATGGTPEHVTKAGAGQHWWPALLPGGRVALFSSLPSRGSFDDADIVAVPLDGGTPKVVLKSAYFPHYAPTGHLIFVQGDSVLAAPFDPKTLSVTGPAVTLLKGVWTSSWTGYADVAFSETGTLVYVSGGPNPIKASLVSVDRSGRKTPLIDERRAYRLPRISPDGRHVAVALVDQQVDIWTYDLAQKSPNRLTDSPSWDAYPLWQPGMRWMAFSSTRDGPPSVYRQDLRSGIVEKLVATKNPTYPNSWSPDGKLLAYEEASPQTGLDIWIYAMDSHSSTPFLRTPYNESGAEFSPDGRFIAYESGEAGEQTEIYVRPYPEINPRRKVSTNGGTAPRWGARGKELFYRVGGKVMSLTIETTPDLVVGTPHELFDGPYGGYDALPNGQSFVMVNEMADGDQPTRINFVLNWFAEVKRLTR
jgi:serine/threonine protein kinase/Tol biopolymer transport system component